MKIKLFKNFKLKKACDFSIPYWSMIYAPDISPMAEIILSIKKCDSENVGLKFV